MTQQEIIIIVATLTFTSTVGVYAAIRYIKLHTRHPVNTLNRQSNDIELMDYIEPSEPVHAYYPIDLSNPQYIYHTPYYENVRAPSYWSGTLPSYHTNDRIFINSYFEDSINIDLIFMVFIFMFFLIIILKMKNSPWIKYLVKWSLMTQLTKILKIFTEIRFFWINLFIIHYNILMNSLYGMSILIPFSLFDIDFRDSFEWKYNSYGVKAVISYHKVQTLTKNIDTLLKSLKDDVNYSMSSSFISSYNKWKDNKEKNPPLFINDAIIVNKESDPILISQFIMRSLNDKELFITNCLFKDELINKMDPVILSVIVPIKVKI